MASTINNDGDFTPISADIRLRANTSNGMPLTHDDVDGNFENLRLGHNAIVDYLNSGLHISSAGNVGIGTTDPKNSKLLIRHDGNNIQENSPWHHRSLNIANYDLTDGNYNSIIFESKDTDGAAFTSGGIINEIITHTVGNEDTKLHFGTTSNNYYSNKVTIDESGKVGIGTTSPDYKLHVDGDVRINNQDKLYIGNEHNYLTSSAANDLNISTNRNVAFSSWTSGTEKTNVTIEEQGDVGIGTTSPAAKLHVNKVSTTNSDYDGFATALISDTDARLQIMSDDAGSHGSAVILSAENKHWYMHSGVNGRDYRFSIGYDESASSGIDTVSTGVDYLNILKNGNVGIGTGSPEGKLEINHSGSWQDPSIHLKGQNPTMKFNDIHAENDWYIHVNSNNFYILVDRQASGDDDPITAADNHWDQPNPLLLEGDTNKAYLFGDEIWHAGNDGSGSGLDADKLDGLHASYFVRSNANDTVTGLLTMSTNGECLRLKGSTDTASPYLSFYQAGTSTDIRRAYIQYNNTTSTLNLYNDKYDEYLKIGNGSDGLEWNVGGTDYTVYHSGNLPSIPSVSSSSQYILEATGTYGTVKVNDDRGVSWAGYAIRDDWVFMSSGSSQAGIYNDTNNQWGIRFEQADKTELYHNGTGRLQTTSSGISVNGYIASTHGLSSSIITSALDSTSAHVALSASAGKNLQDQINNLDTSSTWSGGTVNANIQIQKSYPKLQLINDLIQYGSFGIEFMAHQDLGGTLGQQITTRAGVRYNIGNESLDITAPSSGGLRFNGRKIPVENQVDSRLVAFNDWFAAYGDDDPENLTFDQDSRFASLQDDVDASIGAVYKAIDCRNSKQWSISLRAYSNTASSSGFYIGIFFHKPVDDLEDDAATTSGTNDGVLALSHLHDSSEQPYVGEDGSVLWLRNNGSIGNSEETYYYTFEVPTGVQHFSVGILNWSNMGNNHLYFDPMVQINPVDPFYWNEPDDFAPANYMRGAAAAEYNMSGIFDFLSSSTVNINTGLNFQADGPDYDFTTEPSFKIEADSHTGSASRYAKFVTPRQNYGGMFAVGKTTDGTDQLGWWFNTTGTAADLNLYYANSISARTRSYGILAQSGVATIDSGYNYLGVSKRGVGALSIDSSTSGIGCWDTTKDLTQIGYQSVATVYWEKNGRLVRLSIKISPDSQGFGLEEQGQVNYTGLPYTPSSTQPSVNYPAFGTWRVGNNHAGYYWDSPTTSIPHDLPCEILNGKLILRSPNFRGLDQTNSSTPIYVNISYITDSYN